MKLHKNAKLTPAGRAELVRRVLERHQLVGEVAAAMGVSTRTAFKWLARFRADGPAGLADRSSQARRRPHTTPPAVVAEMVRLRRQRWTGQQIARATGCSPATVAKHLKRLGLARLDDLEPSEPARRYQRQAPGELVHLDVKKLGRIERVGHRITGDRRDTVRGAGWEFAHVAIDDASRLAYAEVLPDEGKDASSGFLERALAWFARLGVRVARIMTDNAPAYRSRTFATLCRRHGIRHLRTRPYTPRTNGKAERFIQTALREWAYHQPYASSLLRTANLAPWLHRYNCHRPHAALAGLPPRSRIAMNNLLRLHS